jgi:serine/threonine-protein kinase
MLPPSTPAPIRKLLRRCLEKDRKRRLDSAADARLEIEEALIAPATADGATASRGPAPRRWMVAAASIVIVSVVLTALGTWALTRPAPAKLQPVHFTIVPPPEHPLAIRGADRDLAVSPDGRYLVYRVGASGALDNPLVVRAFDQLDARPLAGITSARGPFFSPDSRWIGFFDGFEIKKVSVTGGGPVTVCRFSGLPRGASWGDDNTIVFATNDPSTGLWRVSAGGGEPIALTKPDVSQHEGDHVFPSVLPGNRGVLFTISQPSQPEDAQVGVLDLKSGQRKTLIPGGSDAEYVASGHVIYAAGGTLRAARFDLAKLEVVGDPVPIVDHVMVAPGGAVNYTVSRSGTLVYVPGEASLRVARSLIWVDRKGRETPINTPLRAYTAGRLSPDGTRIALDIRDQENDLWIWDLARATLTRLTFGPATEQAPVWTPDGRWIVFASTQTGAQNLFRQATDGTGTAERLTSSAAAQLPTSITPDGTRVIGYETGGKTGSDIILLPLAHPTSQRETGRAPGAGPSEASPLIQTIFNEANPQVSPDGHFLAYQSNESGRPEIYVRPFPDVNAGRWLISTGGGQYPRWRADGRELFYMDEARTLMAVPIQASATTLRAGTPGKVFDTQYANPATYTAYDVSADGQRFLMIKDLTRTGDPGSTPAMVVVLNWFEELKARVPAK